MLVALSPSIHRLRMSSLDYRGEATTSQSLKQSTLAAEGGVSPTTNTEHLSTISPKGRPKLSLQTSSLPSPYAKSSKGVLGSANPPNGIATPTTTNTIANSSLPLRPSPVTPKPSLLTRPPISRPYTQPLGLKSILKNAPDSPKTNLKRTHSLFSADSGSPHTTRRVFFPPVKKVIFEGEDKLTVEIPQPEKFTSPEATPASSGDEAAEDKDESSSSSTDSNDSEATDASTITSLIVSEADSEHVKAGPRTRNGTPPPLMTKPRKRRKNVRKWEWTIITSPGLPKKPEEDTLKQA